ncbi:hypothetical protein LLH23_05840 [bacterium]|nr:hypothetical protein [bacterium]
MFRFNAVLAMFLLLADMGTGLAQTATYTYGNRPIDLLPKSETARPEGSRDWDDPEPAMAYELALHAKNLFRVGEAGLERLCVIEARRPEARRAALTLALTTPLQTLWRERGDWIGPNQRMRPVWLPVRRDLRTALVLNEGAEPRATVSVSLGRGAPAALVGATASPQVPAVDAGFALLPASELSVTREAALALEVAVARPNADPMCIELRDAGDGSLCESWSLPAGRLADRFIFRLSDLPLAAASPGSTLRLTCEALSNTRSLARQELTLRFVDAPAPVPFGARPTDLRYTLPIADGDRERTWDELWGRRDLRDVVVSFPGSPARFVLWRGASYVPCWALPEAWLTYEWLEAEPYFFGADDCVEPLQDRDCRYSRAEIICSTPARAVVVWRYALTDFQGRIIRDEHAEETFTLYPDGVGTRFLRGFYQDGWHENQEFIVINRPGRRASQALAPQALTFYSVRGDCQKPIWPKPGFSLEGWPEVITLVNVGAGPRPFMVTPDAPEQIKVWGKPYVDKLDLFNSYPHWPVTRGLRTSWLDDPRQFGRPTHSNLANLVNRPVRETETEKDWVWLIGVAARDDDALAAAASWLRPGAIAAGQGAVSAAYDPMQRAYVLQAADSAAMCEFTLTPPPGGTLTNPAFVIKGWTGPAQVSIPGAREVQTGQEPGQLVIWARGRFAQAAQVKISRDQ